MTDKEIGELWREAITSYDPAGDFFLNRDVERAKVIALIRKLVAERRKYNTLAHKDGSLSRTIRDFGISEKEWPNG